MFVEYNPVMASLLNFTIDCSVSAKYCPSNIGDFSSNQCNCVLEKGMKSYEDSASLSSIHSTLHNMFHLNQTSCWIMSGCFDHHSFHNDINTNTTDDQPSSIAADIHRDPPSTVQSTYRPKVIDAFIFYDELSMLRLRYEMLRDVVDLFVLIEATHTFTGRPKLLHYELNKHLLPLELTQRTLSVTVQPPYIPATSREEAFQNEYFQRNYLSKLLEEHMELDHRDIVLVSDLDEIFRPSTVHAIVQTYSLGPPASNQPLHIGMLFFYYNLSCVIEKRPWIHPYAITYGALYNTYKNTNWTRAIEILRSEVMIYPVLNLIRRGGWHLSYFKSLSKILDKLDAFAHTEMNTKEIRNNLTQNILNGKSAVQPDHNSAYCRCGVICLIFTHTYIHILYIFILYIYTSP